MVNYKDWIKLDRDEQGFIYVPRFVKQVSDMEYGSIVSHENYNEKLNLNSTQGDYNTEVLRILFTERDAKKTFRIPYLDDKIDTEVTAIQDTLKNFDDRITTVDEYTKKYDNEISNLNTAITNLITGDNTVAKANVADKIAGIDEAGVRKYYGTDFEGTVGYHDVPAAIFTGDQMSELDLLETYFVPNNNTVTEEMLTSEVRAKLNKQAVSDYPLLTNKPQIEGVLLEGNITLEQIGAQPAGEYLTEIPEEYVTSSELNTVLEPYAKASDVSSTYATKSALETLTTTVNNNETNANNKFAVCCVGTFTGTPKTGDLLVVL